MTTNQHQILTTVVTLLCSFAVELRAGNITRIIDSTGVGLGDVQVEAVGISVDGAGNAYVTHSQSQNMFKVSPSGVITEIIDAAGDGAGNSLIAPQIVAAGSGSNVYVAAEQRTRGLRKSASMGRKRAVATSFSAHGPEYMNE